MDGRTEDVRLLLGRGRVRKPELAVVPPEGRHRHGVQLGGGGEALSARGDRLQRLHHLRRDLFAERGHQRQLVQGPHHELRPSCGRPLPTGAPAAATAVAAAPRRAADGHATAVRGRSPGGWGPRGEQGGGCGGGRGVVVVVVLGEGGQDARPPVTQRERRPVQVACGNGGKGVRDASRGRDRSRE